MKELIEAIVKFSINHMSGYDFVVALAIVFVVEYLVKELIFKGKKKYVMVYKIIPIVIGALGYLIYAIVTKQPLHMGIYHGAMIGLCAMGCYDVILDTGKRKGLKGLEEINNAIKDEVTKQ